MSTPANKQTQGQDGIRHNATNLGVTSSYKLKLFLLLSSPKETTEEVEAATQSLEAGRIHYRGNLGKLFLFPKSQGARLQSGDNDMNLVELFSGISTCPSASEFLRGNVSYGQDKHYQSFPGGPMAKTPHSQCRLPGFHPWSGNQIPHDTVKTQRSQIINKYLKIIKHCLKFHLTYLILSSVAQSCPTLCNPVDCSTPGFSVHLCAYISI